MLRAPRPFNRTALFLCFLIGLVLWAAPAHAAEAAAGLSSNAIQLKPVSEINSGDTAWMLTSSALVLMMTGPGLALFYCGLVRRKNVLSTMM